MKYGQPPVDLGVKSVICDEMIFYQYLPIKFPSQISPVYEERLQYFNELVGVSCCDFIGTFGLDRYMASYIYLTAKHMYQHPGCSFNRPGYHSDGFMTDDINYIWSDRAGTIFNDSDFSLSLDDSISIHEMTDQALPENDFSLPDGTLTRLNQFVIHRVNDMVNPGMRTFIKLSFSYDKYDLVGNSHNYLIPYKWEMKPRKDCRNIPQSIIQPFTTDVR